MNIPTNKQALETFGIYEEISDNQNHGPSLELAGMFQGMFQGMFDHLEPGFGMPGNLQSHNGGSLLPPESVSKHQWKDMLHVREYFEQYKWEYFDVFDSLYNDDTSDSIVEVDVANLKNKAADAERDERIPEIIVEVISVDHLFMDIGLFDWHSHPQTYRLMKTIDLIAGHVVLQYKDKYQRRRPTFDHPDLEAIIDVPSHPSWPSGHSTQSHAMGSILTLVVTPHLETRRMKFENTAKRIAENREWAGVHYRSDSEAGVKLSNMLIRDIGVKFQQGVDTRLNRLIKAAIAEWN